MKEQRRVDARDVLSVSDSNSDDGTFLHLLLI